VLPSESGLLVVDGFINSDGPTTIQLSRTMTLNDKKSKPLPELKAQLLIEGDDNSSRALIEKADGLYTIEKTSVDNKKKYRIRIVTRDKKEYVSDFVEVKQTPLIDSVTWEIDDVRRGIQFYVYTHDLENAARYYHWEFLETWQYHADLTTTWEYLDGVVVHNPQLHVYDCWRTKRSTAIYITNTNRLRDDVVSKFPLAFIPATSEKLEIGYHMAIKQYAITPDTYDYLRELKKLSEQQGSIFDAQPSQLLGNVRSITHENEKVLGYVSAHGSSEKNIIIFAGGVLPPWFNGRTTYTSCPISNRGFTITYINQMLKLGLLVPADNPENLSAPWYQPKVCVDCRERGGTNIRPDYWHE
jgi:hypothetical protein